MGIVNVKEGNLDTLTGKLNPVYGLDSVVATNKQTGKISTGTLNVLTGIFSFPRLIPINYEVNVSVRVPFFAPATQKVLVELHKVTGKDTITLLYDNDVRFLRYKVDGS